MLGTACSTGSELVDSAHVSFLSFGVNTLTARGCSEPVHVTDPQGCRSTSTTIRLTYEEVTPKGSAANGFVSEAGTQQFQIQNLLTNQQTFNLAVTCSGTGVSGCSVPSKIRVAGSADSTFTVSFTAGALNSTGTIRVVATDSAQTAAVDTGSVAYTAGWNNYLNVSTAYTNQEDQDMARCASGCFANTMVLSTVPYISRDMARGVTLVYHSDRVAVRPVIAADVWLGAGAYTVQKFQLQAQVDGTWATFTNGETLLTFSPTPINGTTKKFRLAGAIDASALTAGAHGLKIVVTAVYSDHQEQFTDSSHVLTALNMRSSAVGNGWEILGVPYLYSFYYPPGHSPQFDQSRIMVPDGDGSAVVYTLQTCSSVCTWRAPAGVFSGIVARGSGDTTYLRQYPDSSKEFFNATGNLTYVVSRTLADTIHYIFSGSGPTAELIKVTDPHRIYSGAHTYAVLHYDAKGHLASIVEPRASDNMPDSGRKTLVSIDTTTGVLRAWTDPNGAVTKFGYDMLQRLDSVVDAKGHVGTYTYEPIIWKLTSAISPSVPLDDSATGSPSSGVITAVDTAWQTIGVPTSSTGQVTGSPWMPIADSLVIGSVTGPGGAVHFTADPWGQPLTLTDALGSTASFAPDANGFDTTITYASGAVDHYGFSGPFLVRSQPAGFSATSYSYGSFGQLTQVSGSGQPTETLYLGARGHTDSVTVNGSTWRFYADAKLRDTMTVDAQHDTTKYAYDSATGNRSSQTSLPGGRFTSATFDGHGRPRTMKVSTPTGPTVVTTTAYDSVNRVVSVTDGLHATPIRFTYDSLFNTAVSDQLGQTYHYAYNALGWDTTETDTTSRTLKTTYGRFGAPTTSRNRRTQRVQMLYDSHGRDTLVTRQSTEPDHIDHFRYPDLYTAVDSDSVVKDITYDSPTTGLVDSIITTFLLNGHWFKRAYTHDGFGRVTKVAITSNDSATFTFNTRITSYNATSGVIDNLDINSGSNRLTFGYDSLFRVTSITYPNHVIRHDAYYASGQLNYTEWDSLSKIIARTYGYDSTGRVNEIDYNGILSGDTAALLSYDLLGELTQRQLIKWTDTATTCPGTQLQNGFGCRYGSSRTDTVLQTVNYSYDAVGNLDTVKAGTADTVATIVAGNRLTGWTGLTFAVDSDGNRTSTTVGSQTTTYTWGADGRLLSVAQGGNTRTYDYDPSGQLVYRKTNGSIDRYYLWDNGQILAILDGTASHRIAEFVYFGGADAPLARISGGTGTGTMHYYAQDAMGNVVGEFHGDTVDQTLAYDPWGAATMSANADTTQLRWKGLLYEDGMTSLYYVRARWYDPTTRRFVSPDPLGIGAGVNQYAYAGGDPVNGNDPSGTCRANEIQYSTGDTGDFCIGTMGFYDEDGNLVATADYGYYEDAPTLPTVYVTAKAPPPVVDPDGPIPSSTPASPDGGSPGGVFGAIGKFSNHCNAARASFGLAVIGDISFAFGVGEIAEGVKAASFAMSNGARATLLSFWMAGTDAFKGLARKYALRANAYAMMRDVALGTAAHDYVAGLPGAIQGLDTNDVSWRDFVPIADAIKAYQGMSEACSSGD